MLKLIYSETGLFLEHVPLALEDWLRHRISFALQAGETVWVESCRGSILLPRRAATDARLRRPDLEISVCDEDSLEISLSGWWLTPDPETCEGVLGVDLDAQIEQALLESWQEAQVPSVLPLGE